jgi:hypothetical protein
VFLAESALSCHDDFHMDSLITHHITISPPDRETWDNESLRTGQTLWRLLPWPRSQRFSSSPRN